MKEELIEYRCICGKLLFKADLQKGNVEAKCRGCRKITVFKGIDPAKNENVLNR